MPLASKSRADRRTRVPRAWSVCSAVDSENISAAVADNSDFDKVSSGATVSVGMPPEPVGAVGAELGADPFYVIILSVLHAISTVISSSCVGGRGAGWMPLVR